MIIRNLGYNLEVMWENDFKSNPSAVCPCH